MNFNIEEDLTNNGTNETFNSIFVNSLVIINSENMHHVKIPL